MLFFDLQSEQKTEKLDAKEFQLPKFQMFSYVASVGHVALQLSPLPFQIHVSTSKAFVLRTMLYQYKYFRTRTLPKMETSGTRRTLAFFMLFFLSAASMLYKKKKKSGSSWHKGALPHL